jgi:hypothetical protein
MLQPNQKMSVESIPKISNICLIGVNPDLIQILAAYVGHKYRIIAINRQFDIRQLDVYDNILLFIYNSDQFDIDALEFLTKIRENLKYREIPIIALALKLHFYKTPLEIRNQFEDIILLPTSNEDILTRVEVWICTYNMMTNQDISSKTFSLNELKCG